MKVDFTKFKNERRQDLFIEGWKDAGGYMDDCVSDNPAPWCMPWYQGYGEIEFQGKRPEEWGAEWWEMNCEEIEAHVEEAEKLLAEEAE